MFKNKKKVIIIVCALIIVGIGGVKAFEYSTKKFSSITNEKALNVALAHANVQESEISALHIEFDYDDQIAEYEVEFKVGNVEYDYEINAKTGEIKSFDNEGEHFTPQVINTQSEVQVSNLQNTTNTLANELISEEEALSVAINHASINADEITSSYVQLDYDDKIQHYDVDIWVGQNEYEFDIDASSAVVISFSHEINNNQSNITQSESANSFTNDEAKTIALAHAGLSESEVNYLNAYTDYDNGRSIIDVEFYANNVEYDYEINANTGEIIEFDYDAENINPTNQSNITISDEYITSDQAIELARVAAGVNQSEMQFIDWDFEVENGRAEYEVEWNIGRYEYSYTIDAISGNILKQDVEYDD